MQVRCNIPAFQTVNFVMEHDYARCAEIPAKMAYPYKSMLEQIEFEQVIIPMSRGYEERFVRGTTEYIRLAHDPLIGLNVGEQSLVSDIFNIGFAARRYGDELIVTDSWNDERVVAGDRIVCVNGFDIPSYAHQAHGSLRDTTGEDAHQIWDVALQFSKHFHVVHADGRDEDIPTKHFKGQPPVRENSARLLSEGVFLISVADTSDAVAIEASVDAIGHTEGLHAVVIDVREAGGASDAAILPLLPLVIVKRTALHELPGYGAVYLQCSHNNCRLVGDLLDGCAADAPDGEAETLRALAGDIRSKGGTGLQLVDLSGDDGTTVEPMSTDIPVFILADITTCGPAENLVRIAKDAGRATVVGRPTMGSLDCMFPLNVKLDHAYSFSYPAALDPRAYAGDKIDGVGIEPDVSIPWTPEFLREDADLGYVLGR